MSFTLKKTGGSVSSQGTPRQRQSLREAPVEVSEGISLPTELSDPSNSLSEQMILIYGEKKIGKTTLASVFPNAFFLMFEPGGKNLSIYQRPVNSWKEFLQYIQLLEEDDRFETVVIDTVDIAYQMCFDYMCVKMAIDHPADENDYGKSWGEIKKEFSRAINKLSKIAGKGLILVSHGELAEVKRKNGETYHKMKLSLPKGAYEFLSGAVDLWVYYGYQGKERVLTLRGDDLIEAGDRTKFHFWTPDGRKVEQIPMGKSEEEGYENFIRAFNNQQETPDGSPERALDQTKPVGEQIGGLRAKVTLKK